MNLLVTILSLTPAVGAVLRMLEDRPAPKKAPTQIRRRVSKRRARLWQADRRAPARMALWRARKVENPFRALRAA
jgi:hypothetical protein